ncbi:serine/threonine protein phosphatase [Sphingomonadaceae bacterium]|nr:serine/threonine protein phosphatase [Sphingomonadaceae bacterium]
MFGPLRQIFSRKDRAAANSQIRASVPIGQRLYCIGDIHGRLDLFDELIYAIEQDDLAEDDAHTTIILLGDLVDRGPDSAGVIARAREWQANRKVRILAGNHEEMFLRSFEDVDMLRHFLRHGGRSTVFSYGLDRDRYNEVSLGEVQDMMAEVIPDADRDFLRGFEESIVIGDYLFVHAGIAPDVPLEEQKRHDKLWIREQFLRHEGEHSHMVVHGHTIMEDIQDKPNRIGIDTGAYRFGKLTALVLEGETRRFIQAVDDDGTITSRHITK